ncbi:MAG: SpoVG family protein [Planctomycetes bacterium]|nr:SpoVG family protein [Planctomycetota bacterium]
MEITEVRVRLVPDRGDRLKAFCSMTLDDEFVVRDIKVIEGEDGYFVAMPSRKMSDHCARCRGKNHLGARFCSDCGTALPVNRAEKDPRGKAKLHADIAHPINTRCRKRIQDRLILAFREELERSKQPGYRPVETDDVDDEVPDVTRQS